MIVDRSGEQVDHPRQVEEVRHLQRCPVTRPRVRPRCQQHPPWGRAGDRRWAVLTPDGAKVTARRWGGKVWFGIRLVPIDTGTLHVGDEVVRLS